MTTMSWEGDNFLDISIANSDEQDPVLSRTTYTPAAPKSPLRAMATSATGRLIAFKVGQKQLAVQRYEYGKAL